MNKKTKHSTPVVITGNSKIHTGLGTVVMSKTSRVTRVTLVLWIGKRRCIAFTHREHLLRDRVCTHIESRQFIGWWRNAISDAMTSSGHTGERAIHSDFSAEKNPVGSMRSLAANAASRSLFREQGLRFFTVKFWSLSCAIPHLKRTIPPGEDFNWISLNKQPWNQLFFIYHSLVGSKQVKNLKKEIANASYYLSWQPN